MSLRCLAYECVESTRGLRSGLKPRTIKVKNPCIQIENLGSSAERWLAVCISRVNYLRKSCLSWLIFFMIIFSHSKCMLQKTSKPVAFVPAPPFPSSSGESSFCSVFNKRGS